jgi:hypothetical protein
MTFDRRPRRYLTLLPLLSIAMAIGLLTAGGCGAEAGSRRAVSGTVTFNGAPLDRGTITFTATSDSGGERGGALIDNGKYELPAAHGLEPGTYRVEISSPEESTSSAEDYAAGNMPLTNPDRIAAEFNTESSLTVEVTSSGPNEFNFAVR